MRDICLFRLLENRWRRAVWFLVTARSTANLEARDFHEGRFGIDLTLNELRFFSEMKTRIRFQTCFGFTSKLTILLFLAAISTSPGLLAADIQGSKDHPMVTRFPKSEIVYYSQQPFDEFRLHTGPLEKGKTPPIPGTDLTGKITRIQYGVPGRTSVAEVYDNYRQALTAAGFEPIFEGTGKDGFGYEWVSEAYKAPLPGAIVRALMITPDNDRRRFLAARLARPEEGDVYVQLVVNDHRPNDLRVMLDVIETQPPKKDQVTVDAARLGKAILAEGHVVVEGIYFDTDKATLKPESNPALEQMAKLMTDQPKLSAYVVGHTDGTGSLAHNMELSRARARSVATALVERHGIVAGRLEGHGVGPLAPIATNEAENGKAKNRRVELVAR